MADLMTIDQYQTRLGRSLAPTKATQAEAFLEDASDEVRRIADGELDDATHETVTGTIRLVIFSMVTRAINNPRGVTAQRIGDYQEQGSRPVYATEEEQQLIRSAVGTSAVGEVELTSDLPQRLLDEAASVPYLNYLGE